MEPLATLHSYDSRSISSLSIIKDPNNGDFSSGLLDYSNHNDYDYDYDSELHFRCSNIIQSSSKIRPRKPHAIELNSVSSRHKLAPMLRDEVGTMMQTQKHVSTLSKMEANAANLSLSGALIATSDTDGLGCLWNVSTRRIVAEFGGKHRGSGLTIRRMNESNNFLYHSRGCNGLVTIHDIEQCTNSNSTILAGSYAKAEDDMESSSVIASFSTGSRTFCAAAPCRGDPNLVLLPSEDETICNVRDLRMDTTKNTQTAFACIHGAYGSITKRENNMRSLGSQRKYGMITSLAMISSNTLTSPTVACGMESGDLFFHNLTETSTSQSSCVTKLGKDPILCLDLAPSSVKPSSKPLETLSSILSIAGCAGDADEQKSLPQTDQGAISIVKTIIYSNKLQPKTDILQIYQMKSRLRKRLGTCQIGESAPGGKPGVSTCRFRDDGQLFAVGGWDKRIRIFSRDGSNRIAILKGHSKSITALDWSQNARENGLLVTGSDDGSIKVWRVLPSVS